jgi:carboxylesterase type B
MALQPRAFRWQRSQKCPRWHWSSNAEHVQNTRQQDLNKIRQEGQSFQFGESDDTR